MIQKSAARERGRPRNRNPDDPLDWVFDRPSFYREIPSLLGCNTTPNDGDYKEIADASRKERSGQVLRGVPGREIANQRRKMDREVHEQRVWEEYEHLISNTSLSSRSVARHIANAGHSLSEEKLRKIVGKLRTDNSVK